MPVHCMSHLSGMQEHGKNSEGPQNIVYWEYLSLTDNMDLYQDDLVD